MKNKNIAILNQPIANLVFSTTENTDMRLADLQGKLVVLYFYPKDNTPGCIMEAKNFRDLYPKFLTANTCIFGISRDSLKSHQSFKNNCDLPFPLISDENEELCRYFNVIKEKNMFGKKIFGLERSTFLIDEKGILTQEWRNVKVPQHAQAVLDAVLGR